MCVSEMKIVVCGAVRVSLGDGDGGVVVASDGALRMWRGAGERGLLLGVHQGDRCREKAAPDTAGSYSTSWRGEGRTVRVCGWIYLFKNLIISCGNW